MPLAPRFERFVERVTESGCWLWTGAAIPKGYGVFPVRHGSFRECYAHRVAWRLFVGPIPAGLHILHRCDVPCCVNPDHLFVGTAGDNMRDMRRKGRNVPHPHTRLNAEMVRDIRAATANGESKAACARRLGISASAVYNVTGGHRWKGVT